MEDLWIEVVTVAVPIFVGLVLGIFIVRSINSSWYQGLLKPSFHPPDWLIPFSFTILNGLMGYAAVRVLLHHNTKVHGSERTKLALISYLVQFFLTGLWPIMFFICKKTTLSLIQIMIVDAAVLFSVKLFFTVDRVAGFLAVPHLLWTIWWTILLYCIWLLNYHQGLTDHERMLSTDRQRNSPSIRTYGSFS